MIKLIVFDLDDTVLNDQKAVDSDLKETLKKLREKYSIRFTIASGRNEDLISDYVDYFELSDPYIVNNGGNVCQSHRCLFSEFIPSSYNNILGKVLMEHEIPFRLFSTEASLSYSDSAIFSTRITKHLKKILKPYDPGCDLSHHHIFKVTADFTGREEKIEEVCRIMKERCPEMHFLRSENSLFCANALNANKGSALQKICAILDIDLQQVMAFGDSYNDLPMFERSGISVAVANACSDLLEACDYVCADNNHNGVSSFLKMYFRL